MKKISLLGLALVLSILATAFLFFQYLESSGTPNYQVDYQIPGLYHPVRIYRDKRGVPHIYAKEQADAFRAYGFLAAEDRLFQMDIYRRLASGTLSEILGELTIKSDKKFRSLRLRTHMEEMFEQGHIGPKAWPAEMNEIVDAYYAGINSYIDMAIKEGKLPIEYRLIGAEPAHFGPLDGLAFTGVMGFNFAAGHKQDFINSSFKKKLGPELFELIRREPKGNSIDVLTDFSPKAQVEQAVLAFAQEMTTYMPAIEGSNGWLISGELTKSKKPILANDPHIGFSMPGIWYEAHLKTNNWEIYGHFLPAVPFPVLGHNSERGWGMTMTFVDDMNIYRETFTEDRKKILIDNTPTPIRIIKEEIKVKGKDSVPFEYVVTPHGPSLKELFGMEDHTLFWTHYLPTNDSMQGLYGLVQAKSMEEFKEALKLPKAPGINILYADRENIAHFIMGEHPELIGGDIKTDVVLDGNLEAHQYKGPLGFDKRPHRINPKEGMIVSANARPPGSLRSFRGDWEGIDRYETILSNLKRITKHTADDQAIIQTKNENINLGKMLSAMFNLVDAEKLNDEEKAALDILRKWDTLVELGKPAPLIFHFWMRNTFRGLLDEFTDKEFYGYCRSTSWWTMLHREIESKNESKLWASEGRVQVITNSLKTAVQALKKKYGSDMSKWDWGNEHQLTFAHPLGKNKWLAKIFNHGPHPVPSAYNFVNNFRSVGCENGFQVKSGPSTRRVIDFGNPNASYGILPLGNSGHRKSPFYDNQLKGFIKGIPAYQWLSLELIQANLHSSRIFSPAK